MPKGWGSPSTAKWVRDYLKGEGKSDIHSMWKFIKEKSEGEGYAPPSYGATRKLIYILKKLGLIRLVGKEPSSKKGFPKSIYSLVLGMERADKWDDPTTAFYYPKKFKGAIRKKG